MYYNRSTLSHIKSKDVRNIVLKGTWVSLRHLDFHFSKYISNLKLGGLRYFEEYFLLRYERRYFSLWQICLLGQVGCQVTQKIRYQSNIDWGETPEKQGDRRTGLKGKWEWTLNTVGLLIPNFFKLEQKSWTIPYFYDDNFYD